MTTILKLICKSCRNYAGNMLCSAFPEGIPEEIVFGENNHDKPLKDQDNNIVFEKNNEDEEDSASFMD